MPKVLAAWGLVMALGALGALIALPADLLAQEAKTEKAKTEDAKTEEAKAAAAPETAEEKKERAGRSVCYAALCSVLYNRKPAEGQVACNIRKTWRKEALSKILARGKVSWPWGDMRCSADVKVDRALLAKVMAEPELEAQFDTYDIRCQIDNAEDKYEVAVQMRPKVTFKQGKATKAHLNWGKIAAPTLAKTVLWSITAADNTFGLLRSMAVEDINKFIGTKCMEVKEAWQGK